MRLFIIAFLALVAATPVAAHPRHHRHAHHASAPAHHARFTARHHRSFLARILPFLPDDPLRGSPAAMERQNAWARQAGLQRVEDDRALAALKKEGKLVPLPRTKTVFIYGKLPQKYQFVRPDTEEFILNFASAYHGRFGKKLPISSAVRTVSYQRSLRGRNGNAAPADGPHASSHLWGTTFDIAALRMSTDEQSFVEGKLRALEREGRIVATKEVVQRCYHIFVRPGWAVKEAANAKRARTGRSHRAARLSYLQKRSGRCYASSMDLVARAIASVGVTLAAFAPLHAVLSHAAGASTSPAPLPALAVQGNRIYRTDTGETVVLRGAITNYFREGTNMGLVSQGLQAELARVEELHEAKGNLIGVYISGSDELRAHIADLDEYVDFAAAHGMYVYLMPVARDFEGTPQSNDSSPSNTFAQLQSMLDFLSARYAHKTNVLYGFGAEPDGETPASWDTKEVELARTIRKNDPNALLLVTGTQYFTGLNRYVTQPFPFDNVVYAGGGYAADSIAYAAAHPDDTARHMVRVRAPALSAIRPYLAAEFGGYSMTDFTTENDREILARMLDDMNASSTNYTMYKLSATGADDGFAVYDTQGVPTKKGRVFLDALAAAPPTQF